MKPKFQEYQEIYKKLMDEVRQNGKRIFEHDIKDFMEANPEVLAFHFYGYTPGFNDGDPCEHRLCGPYLVLHSDFHEAHQEYLTGQKRVCPKDSVVNDADSTFCKKCGTALDASQSGPSEGTASWKEFTAVMAKNDKFQGNLAKERFSFRKDSKTPNEGFYQFLEGMGSEALLEHIYSTNYQVTALRTAQGIEIKGEYYDCGY